MTRRASDEGFDLAFLLFLIPGSLAGVFFSNGWTVAGWIAGSLCAVGVGLDLAARRRRGG